MIIDHIENASLYCRLDNLFTIALRAIQTGGLLCAEPGRHELDSPDLFAVVQRYETKPYELGKWEAHRRHIDLQYLVSGSEVMGYAHLGGMTVTEPYNEEKDIMFLAGKGDFFCLSAGMFVIFYPHDVHMPMLAVESAAPVHKIVMKVRID